MARNCREFCRKWRLPRRKFTTWDRRLYFSSEGRRAEDFFARKIRRLRPGLNQRTLVPEANTLTSRPPKPPVFHPLPENNLASTLHRQTHVFRISNAVHIPKVMLCTFRKLGLASYEIDVFLNSFNTAYVSPTVRLPGGWLLPFFILLCKISENIAKNCNTQIKKLN